MTDLNAEQKIELMKIAVGLTPRLEDTESYLERINKLYEGLVTEIVKEPSEFDKSPE